MGTFASTNRRSSINVPFAPADVQSGSTPKHARTGYPKYDGIYGDISCAEWPESTHRNVKLCPRGVEQDFDRCRKAADTTKRETEIHSCIDRTRDNLGLER